MVVTTGDCHELCKKDEIINGSRKNAEAEEDGKEEPLLNMAEDVPRGILGIKVGCGLLAVSLQLIQA